MFYTRRNGVTPGEKMWTTDFIPSYNNFPTLKSQNKSINEYSATQGILIAWTLSKNSVE